MQEGIKPISYKTKILKFIAEQGIVSIEDINRYFHPDRDNAKAIRVTLYAMGVGHLRYYSPEVKNGIWYIKDQKHYQELDSYDADFFYFKVKKPLVHLIPHYLELNRLRTVIEHDYGVNVEQWISEPLLRALPPALRKYYCSAKIPDAIFYIKTNEGSRKFYLEYERSLKNPQRYGEIFKSYCEREDVTKGGVLYICHTQQLRSKIMGIMKRHERMGVSYFDSDNFQFVSLEKFYQTAAEEKAKKKLGSTPEHEAKLEAAPTV